MDEHYEWLGDVFARDLSKEPSEYFKRQCFVSVECDEEPFKGVFDLMGVANIVCSTDFPHPDCKLSARGRTVPGAPAARCREARDPLGQLREVLRPHVTSGW